VQILWYKNCKCLAQTHTGILFLSAYTDGLDH